MFIGRTLTLLVLTSLAAFASDPPPSDHPPAHGAGPVKGAKAPKASKAAAQEVHSHAASGSQHGPAVGKSAPDEALRRLIAGNKRYVSATSAHPNQTLERRTDQAQGQTPFAIIVSCSDSRVPPEVVFDQGIGDLFVIRSAGEVVTDVGIGSIEYAAAHLGISLIMVMGHERCGAVKATLDGGEAPGSIGSVVNLIKPAVDKAKSQGGDVLEHAIRYNVSLVSERIAASPIIRDKMARGELKIVRGVYDLEDGMVKPIP
ncbi:MAG: carbonic anhydrase [Fibrobacterota bacterium]|nr:carbonic anhydrase [Fibrobacterota bacterium]